MSGKMDHDAYERGFRDAIEAAVIWLEGNAWDTEHELLEGVRAIGNLAGSFCAANGHNLPVTKRKTAAQCTCASRFPGVDDPCPRHPPGQTLKRLAVKTKRSK